MIRVDPLLAEAEEQFGQPGRKGTWFLGIGSVISGIGSLVGGALGSDAAGDAAGQQIKAFEDAIKGIQGSLNQTTNNFSPYMNFGKDALPQLAGAVDASGSKLPYTLPNFQGFNPKDLESTPGYQFTLGQGLKSVQNGYAAQGLGSSGAAMKGGADYATGLASNTYNQQLQNYLTQQQQGWSQSFQGNNQNLQQKQIQNQLLLGAGGLGLGATGNLGAISSDMQKTIAQLMGGVGTAGASGTIGSANAWTNALSNLGGSATIFGMNNGGGGGIGGGGGVYPMPIGPTQQGGFYPTLK